MSDSNWLRNIASQGYCSACAAVRRQSHSAVALPHQTVMPLAAAAEQVFRGSVFVPRHRSRAVGSPDLGMRGRGAESGRSNCRRSAPELPDAQAGRLIRDSLENVFLPRRSDGDSMEISGYVTGD